MRETIEKAVQEAESKTIGEIVPMVLKASNAYPAVSWRFAFVFSVFLSGATYLLYPYFDTLIYFLFQLVFLLLGLGLIQIPGLKRHFLSQPEIEEETYQRAIQAFYENNLHTTHNRTGILIFVSLLEHKIHILADSGIHQKVEKDTWQIIVKQLSTEIRKNNLKEGLREAILKCGDMLSHHFPKTPSNPNELSNKLITE